jgi:hypothetical protein
MKVLLAALLLAVFSLSIRAEQPQSLDDAWWTGPMLAPSAATLPEGHALAEPYLYDAVSPHESAYRSWTYLLYGVTDRFTAGLIPVFGLNSISGKGRGGAQLGDVTLQAQYRLTQFEPGDWMPTLSAVVKENLPTASRADFGSGLYATTVGLYAQTCFWLPNGRILRVRLDLEDATRPGNVFSADLAWEYSLTREWVLALDVTRNSNRTSAFAPAIEYNWRPDMGVLVGVRAIPAGPGNAPSLTPAVALNMVF